MNSGERHEWRTKDNGDKHCEKCGSIVRKVPHFRLGKYQERDQFGILEQVSWYPRCFPLKMQPDKRIE